MPPFFSNKKLILLLASLILLVALIGYSIRDRKQMGWPEQFVHDTAGWFQIVFNRPAQLAAGLFETINHLENTYRENRALKANLEGYAEVKQENIGIKHENDQLRKELGVFKDPDLRDYKKHPALVISRSYDQWNHLLTVNKGEQDGIKPNMAVITADGFVGKIKQVGQFTSVVALISDSENANQIAAMVQGTGIYGMIESYDAQKGVLLFSKIPVKADIKKGQTVTTSGLGHVFVKGLIIGKVKSVTTDQYGLTKVAEVEPAADLNDLSHVIIVERQAPSGISNQQDQKEPSS